MQKKIIYLIIIIILTSTINTNYVKSAQVVVPVVKFARPDIWATIFGLVGLTVPAEKHNNDDILTIQDQVLHYVDTVHGHTDIGAKLMDIVANAEITGRIENFTKDIYDSLKSFANTVINKIKEFNNPLPLPQGDEAYVHLAGLMGWDLSVFTHKNADYRFLSGVKTCYAYDNIFIDYQKATNGVVITAFDNAELDRLGYILAYAPVSYPLREQYTIRAYHKNGRVVSYPDSYPIYSATGWVSNGAVYGVSSSTIGLTHLIDDKTLYTKGLTNIYPSIQAYLDGASPIAIDGADDIPNLGVLGGVDKLWDNYGSLDNLDVVSGVGVIGRDGVIGVDVIGEKAWEKVHNGEIALEDELPYTLVDSATGCIVNHKSYEDDEIEDLEMEGFTGSSTSGFTADLSQFFPFCVPFDLIRAIKTLQAKPVAPKWVLPIKSDRFNIDEEIIIDMSQFEDLAVIFRIGMTLLFIVGLIIATRGLIKG